MTDQFLSPTSYNDLDKADGVRHVQRTGMQIFEIALHCQKKPLDDVQVRKAIALAFDYETARENIWLGADACPGPVPKVMYGHNDDIDPVERISTLQRMP